MFDNLGSSQESHKPPEGINLLPQELRAKTEHPVRPKKTPVNVHQAPKANIVSSPAALPKPAKPTSQPAGRLTFFQKLFSHQPHSKPAPAIQTIVPSVAPAEQKPSTPIPAAPATPRTKVVPPPPEETKNGLEVNLLPPKPKRLTDTQIIFSYFFIFVICLLAIFTPYIFYRAKNKSYRSDNAIVQNQLALISQRTQELQTQIKDYGSLAMQLKNINTIFANHLYWSRFFPTLEQHTIGNVYFTSLVATTAGRISLDGDALDLRAAAEELVVMNNSSVYQNVKLEGLSFEEPEAAGEPGIKFSLSFDLPKSVIQATSSSAFNQ